MHAFRTPELTLQLAAEGVEVAATTPAQFAVFIRDETVKWAQVIKMDGLKPK